MQKSKLQFKIQNYLIILLLSFIALPVFAAEVSVDSGSRTIGIGEQFEAGFFLNTENEDINAVEGAISFPSNLLELKEIRDGNSIINFWIEKPKVGNGAVAFSGIIPGGYSGHKGLILSLVFQTRQEGNGIIEVRNFAALKNDGEGTAADARASNFSFLISKEAPKIEQSLVKDIEPPESFAPEIANDPALFEGKWFLVFATQDKSSGIAHFEIKESRQRFFSVFKNWISTESPYVLQDQELRSYIFIKAVDKDGNIRVEKISPQNPLHWYENYENWIIIIMIGLVLTYVLRKFLWGKRKKYNF